jgi:hypothetical protein
VDREPDSRAAHLHLMKGTLYSLPRRKFPMMLW